MTVRTMRQFLLELFGRDSLSQRMKALSRIRECQRKIIRILEFGLIDERFDDERNELRRMLDSVCDRLYHKVTYSNWWEDWRQAIEKQKREKAASKRPRA